jgi:hypothetical protein
VCPVNVLIGNGLIDVRHRSTGSPKPSLIDFCYRSTGSPKPSRPTYHPHYHFDDEGYQDENDDDDHDASVKTGDAVPVIPTEVVPSDGIGRPICGKQRYQANYADNA